MRRSIAKQPAIARLHVGTHVVSKVFSSLWQQRSMASNVNYQGWIPEHFNQNNLAVSYLTKPWAPTCIPWTTITTPHCTWQLVPKRQSFLHGTDSEAKGQHGWTPLLSTIMTGRYNVACELIDLGVNLNARDAKGRSALHLLITSVCWRLMHRTVFERIIAQGTADVNAQDLHGDTPLQYASQHCYEWAAEILLIPAIDIPTWNYETTEAKHHSTLPHLWQHVSAIIRQSFFALPSFFW